MDNEIGIGSGADLGGSDIDGRYVLKSKLGEGGMGIVYKAMQLSTSREVAFKIVKVDVGDDVRLERFKQEVEIISNLSHPNIVRVIDTGTVPDHDLLYVVMELIEGIPLSDLLWHKHAEGQYFKCRTRVEFALEVIYQLCAALTEPHRQGIIHRDIKPENILISPSSDETVQLKVLDFGIARVLNASKTSQKKMTDSRIPFVGTPHYMAPEQVARSQYDARTDLYAVGVVLFEMLSAQYPFDNENLLALLLQKTQREAPSLSTVLPEDHGLLQDVIDLTDKLLARDQEERPLDAMKVRRLIEDIRDDHRLRRVRIDIHDFFERSRVPALEASLDEDERLEPYRKLYRPWLLYPSGKPILATESTASASASAPADLEPVEQAVTPPVSQGAQQVELGAFQTSEQKQKQEHTSDQFIAPSLSTDTRPELPIITPVLPAFSLDTQPSSASIEESSASYDETEQGSIDLAEEGIDSHTDVLAAPKRNKLKAWHVDINWTNSFDVSELKDSNLDVEELGEYFEEDEDENDDLDEVATSIWKPDENAIPADFLSSFSAFDDGQSEAADQSSSALVDDAPLTSNVSLNLTPPSFSSSPAAPKHTPDFGAMPMALDASTSANPSSPEDASQAALPRDAETVRERALVGHVIGKESYPSHSDTIPEPFSVRTPEIQEMLNSAARSRAQESTITTESGLHSLIASEGSGSSPIAKVALFDEDDNNLSRHRMMTDADIPSADAAVSVLPGSHLRDPSLSIGPPTATASPAAQEEAPVEPSKQPTASEPPMRSSEPRAALEPAPPIEDAPVDMVNENGLSSRLPYIIGLLILLTLLIGVAIIMMT